MSATTTTTTKKSTIVGLEEHSSSTTTTATKDTNGDYIMRQQQPSLNNHYYQHATTTAAAAAGTRTTSPTLISQQHPVGATAAVSTAAATSLATFNGNSQLNSKFTNGNSNNNNNNNNGDNTNSSNNSSHASLLYKIEGNNGGSVATIAAAVAGTATTAGGSIVGISLPPNSVLKKSQTSANILQHQQQQQMHASREDVASLGSVSAINGQISATNGIAGTHSIHHNGIGNPVRSIVTPTSILKGSKENLLQNYYKGENGVGGGGSSIGSESSVMVGSGTVGGTENEDPGDGLGPLPPKWETAYTERGELYFIDHNTGTSHWLDPRLSKYQKKSLEDCCEDELPYGWEKIEDSLYGTYYIDHVNRRTQYENPVLEAKRRAAEQKQSQQQQQRSKTPTSLPSGMNGALGGGNGTNSGILDISRRAMQPPPPQPPPAVNIEPKPALLPYKFTRNPAELQGERLTTTLLKSARGLGITIVGGDNNNDTLCGVDEFLQIKSVVPNGPAWLDGQLQTGDVLVYVNDTCVLGFTHHEMVNIFQSILPGETVTLEICRGYPLPFDPNDPNTEVVTTIAVDGITSESEKQRRIIMDLNMDGNYNFLDVSGDANASAGQKLTSTRSMDSGQFILMKKPEIHTFSIVKGTMGFGFTIADSACGQKVKKILDRNCCTHLQEGDVLLEINEINVRNKSHMEVVQVLKDCSKTQPTTLRIQRVPAAEATSATTPGSFGNVAKLRKNFVGGTATTAGGGGLFRSKTPTADLYSTQQKEVLPMRPKTPLVDTRRARVKTPSNELNDDAEVAAVTTNGFGEQQQSQQRTLAESKTQVDGKSNNSLQDLDDIPYMDPYPKLVSRLSERLAEASILGDSTGNSAAAAAGYNMSVTSNPNPNLGANYARYDNQEYVSAASQHSGLGNYNAIYGMTTLPPSMQPLNQQHGGGVAPHMYGAPLNLMTPTSTSSAAMGYSNTTLPHHEGCYCYDCQDMRNKYRYNTQQPQQQMQPQQQQQQLYYNQQMPLTPLSSVGSLPNHHHHHPQPQQYSPLASSGGVGSTLQAAHIQNERMQKRVNELLNDRRRVGFTTLDTPMQQHSPIVSGSGTNSIAHQPNINHWNTQSPIGGTMPVNTLSMRNGGNPLLDVPEDAEQYELTEVTLERQALGFGFRIVGGTEEGSQVTVGHIVPGGAADNDHRIATGDEILSIDGVNVVNSSHHKVVSLVGESALRGQVTMILRRRVRPLQPLPAMPTLLRYPYDVIVTRHENEGFGFVIISSSNQYYGSTIGKLIPGSPADRCGELKVGDRIIAVNRIDIAGMSHGDVVNLIKESGLHVRLTIGCPLKESTAAISPGVNTNSPLQQQQQQQSPGQLTQPPAPTPNLNGLQQLQTHKNLELQHGYLERPSSSAAAAAAALSLHQQPQL